MADSVSADKESHHWPIQVDSEQPAPPVNAAEQERLQRLLNFTEELLERKEKQESDLSTEADQTTNALLQICGIYFAFVGLLLSVVANGANIKCRHLWSPIVLCTLGSIGFWIAFCYLVFVFGEKEFSRQKLVEDIKVLENCKKKITGNSEEKFTANSLSTIAQKDVLAKAVSIGLIPRPVKKPTPEVDPASSPKTPDKKRSKESKKNWQAKVNDLDDRATGLFFYVFFLGGLALVASYFAVIFSIVQILCH